MKRLVFGLALVIAVFGATVLFKKPAEAFSLFGLKIDFSSSQTKTTTMNGKTHTSHSSTSYHYDSSKDDNSDPCWKFKNQKHDICASYIGNATEGDLVPFYSFVHDGDTFMRNFAANQLNNGFSGQAQRMILDRVNSWPDSDLNVSAPKINVLSVNMHHGINSATIHTKETWSVVTDTGRTIFNENGKHHTVTLHKSSNDGLNQWMVTDIH